MRFRHIIRVLLLSALATSSAWAQKIGDKVPFGQYGDPKDYSLVIVGYEKSLGTDKIIGNMPPQMYGELLDRASEDSNKTGVRHYFGPPLKFRIIEASGVAAGTQARLLKSGRFVGKVPLAAGTIFEIGGMMPATAVFIVPRSAWNGANPVVCYELLPGQGYRLTDIPDKANGKYKDRENLDCSPLGDIVRIMANPAFNRIRLNAIIDKGDPRQ